MDLRVPVDMQLMHDLHTIKDRTIFFGHHSVGRDILDGVRELADEAGVDVALAEGPVGRNEWPLEKFQDFERQVLTRDDDVVAMKLCFVDFRPDTHVQALVDGYVQTVMRIRAVRPDLAVLHITPALTTRALDLKSRLNRFFGRPVWEDAANLRRLEYAERIRAAFPRDVFFDLAATESTRPDGMREMHIVGDRQVPMMWPGYSDDGGHLNGIGRRHAARAFIRALAEATTRAAAVSPTAASTATRTTSGTASW